MTDPCPGPCNTAWRKLPPEQRDQTPPTMGDPVWCHTCAIKIRRTIGDLQTLAALLEHRNDGYGEQPEEPGRRTHAHPPSPSPGFDTLDEIESMLRGWEHEYWRIRRYGSTPIHGRYASVSMEITATLFRHFDAILESPFALEFGEEVLRAAWHLVNHEKAGLGHRRGKVPCPRCDHLGLFSIDDGYVYICTFCNKPVPKQDYDALCDAARAATC